jgi:hypothetical protein
MRERRLSPSFGWRLAGRQDDELALRASARAELKGLAPFLEREGAADRHREPADGRELRELAEHVVAVGGRKCKVATVKTVMIVVLFWPLIVMGPVTVSCLNGSGNALARSMVPFTLNTIWSLPVPGLKPLTAFLVLEAVIASRKFTDLRCTGILDINRSSIKMPATVDADTFTGDEITVNQEEHRFSDFPSSAPPLKGRGIHRLGVLLRS